MKDKDVIKILNEIEVLKIRIDNYNYELQRLRINVDNLTKVIARNYDTIKRLIQLESVKMA
jgi:hypothetical protein